MDVLVVGGVSKFVNDIISKLNKEGHRVFVLTGNKYHVSGYKNAFELYKFSYDSDSLNEIFESINPDLVIFMGAYDSNFNWFDAKKEAVRYIAGLWNCLMSYSQSGKGRFIYLSSQIVYGESYENLISEEEPVSAMGEHAMAILHGEDMCRRYCDTTNVDAVVLRLDNVYDIPKNKNEINNICSFMCLEALKTGMIPVNSKHVLSLLYVSDAVEYIYKLVECEEHKEALYHISTSTPVNELQLAQSIKKNFEEDVEIEVLSRDTEVQVVLSNEKFFKEFYAEIFFQTDDVIKDMVTYMKRHKGKFLEKQDKKDGSKRFFSLKGLFRTILPYVENLICFIPFFMLNNRAVGSEYFANLDFYLIYVLLFAIVYGQQQATFSAVLAVAGYCFRQMYNRSSFDVMLDYNTYMWIAQLFVLGLVVGYMRDQFRTIKGEEEREIKYLTGQLTDIQDVNISNMRMKNVLETQIINHNDSLGKIYEVTSELDKYEPEEVLFYAAEVLAKLMGSNDVAIYTVANKSYARLFSATSSQARVLGNSIQYTELTDMYDVLIQRRVFINKSLDDRYPIMANAIYSEEDMQLILMVWGVPWEKMTLGQSNLLAVIGYLIQNALLRANRYIEALEHQRYIEGTRVLEPVAFTSLVKAYLGAREKKLTECAILYINIDGNELENIGVQLSKLLRQTDFLGQLEDGKLYVLLSNTDNDSAKFVKSRFEEAGYRCSIQEEIRV